VNRNTSKLNKLNNRDAQNGSGGGEGVTMFGTSSFMLLFHILRGILYIPHTMPGAEHTFHLLTSIWPDLSKISRSNYGGNSSGSVDVRMDDGSYYIRSMLGSMLDICLRILSRPQRTDPSADKGMFMRLMISMC